MSRDESAHMLYIAVTSGNIDVLNLFRSDAGVHPGNSKETKSHLEGDQVAQFGNAPPVPELL
jgi:hypothetical protein